MHNFLYWLKYHKKTTLLFNNQGWNYHNFKATNYNFRNLLTFSKISYYHKIMTIILGGFPPPYPLSRALFGPYVSKYSGYLMQ